MAEHVTKMDIIARVKDVTIRVEGGTVSVDLHCRDAYMARVMFEDFCERAAVGRVCLEFGMGVAE